MKALLAANDVDPPRVHDLEVLLEMCADHGHNLTDFRAAVLDLNPFAVQFRYPTEETAPEEEEVQEGLETAKSIRQRVQTLLPNPGDDLSDSRDPAVATGSSG